MSADHLRLPLYPQLWDNASRTLLESRHFSVRAWTYPSGVKALSLENSRGKLVILPWQGQMIWSAEFDGQSAPPHCQRDRHLWLLHVSQWLAAQRLPRAGG
jgi:hypothetical protein